MRVTTWSLPPLVLAAALFAPAPSTAQESVATDVCVYGATPSGILAAVAVAREGQKVLIVEPSRWVGGILGAGLKPTQDCPNIHATGGLTRSLLETLGHPLVMVDGQVQREKVSLRDMNPGDIRRDFRQLLQEHNIRVVFEHRVSRCTKTESRITTASFDLAPFDALGCPPAEPQRVHALVVRARQFIDASYEGDLMARAGVSYRVGRESTEEFGEEFAGVQPPAEDALIDPFVIPGDPQSGLLPLVEQDHGQEVGASDPYTQAYNYRYYTTDDPAYRIGLTPPADYDPRQYELVGRYVDYLVHTTDDQEQLNARLARIFPGWNNSGVWNYHRDSLLSMAPVGISHRYADGDYATKAAVWKQHQDYLRGLHQFLSTDRRVPEQFRNRTAALGLDGRHHSETGGWPHQLYVRVSRRMKGRYTITAHDVYNRTEISDPVGLAQYGIDTYPARRIWYQRDGHTYVALEGKMFVGGSHGPTNVPYPISYRALTPQQNECSNLLVSVCFSATHLGYASARMEPVFMICGESAGIAACHALAQQVPVQQIDPDQYQHALRDAGQVLAWSAELAAQAKAESQSKTYSFARLRAEADTNGDQRVSQAEWDVAKPSWEWLFALTDKNQDGVIDDAEYAALQQYKQQHADWQQRLRQLYDATRSEKELP